jgi:hypothetical protein
MRAAIVHNLRGSLWSTFAVMMVMLLALMFFRDRHPVNYGLFFAFTVAVSFHIGIVGAICAEAGMAMTVLNAGVVTLGVFASLTAYAMYSKQDFSWMQAYLFTGLNCMILWGLFALIVGWQVRISAGFANLFSFFQCAQMICCLVFVSDRHRSCTRCADVRSSADLSCMTRSASRQSMATTTTCWRRLISTSTLSTCFCTFFRSCLGRETTEAAGYLVV